MFQISEKDDRGNMIYSKGDKVYLYIALLKSVRELCKIRDGDVYITRKNKHIFRKLNAYGFNYSLIRLLPDNTQIYLKQENSSVIKTTPEDILHKGKFLNFGMQGFEKQVFLPINDFYPLS